MNLRTDALDYSGSVTATSTMWVFPTSSSWVEQGVANDSGTIRWYWAEVSGLTAKDHYPGLSFSYTTTYGDKISWNAPANAWAVYRDGSFVANTTINLGASTINETESGAETTSDAVSIGGEASAMQKRGSDGNWTYNWGGATTHVQSPLRGGWFTQYADWWYSNP